MQLLVLSLLLSLSSPVTGVVVDPSGRPIPRATISISSSTATSTATVFTDADGTFRFDEAPDGCRVHVALTGFQTASAECGSGVPLKITLALAPVAESIVVSATRTEAPASQVGTAVTVFDAAEIERRQQPLLAAVGPSRSAAGARQKGQPRTTPPL